MFLCCAALCANAQKGSQLPLFYQVENTGAAFAKPDMPEASKLPVIKDLPDPLKGVKNFKGWARKRSEIAHLIQHYGIGEKPAVSKECIKARMNGDTLIVDVTVNGETLTLSSEIKYPKTGNAPFALMIGSSMIADGKTKPCMITVSATDFSQQQGGMQMPGFKMNKLDANDYPTWSQRRRALVKLLLDIKKQPDPEFPAMGGGFGGGFGGAPQM